MGVGGEVRKLLCRLVGLLKVREETGPPCANWEFNVGCGIHWPSI